VAIKARFSNDKTAKSVRNVGDLMHELGRLPAETKVKCDMSSFADVVLFNVNRRDAFVTLTEGGEWDDSIDEPK
jgi:hypothetical protein